MAKKFWSFLEGVGILVNEVVMTDRVLVLLIQGYGIIVNE